MSRLIAFTLILFSAVSSAESRCPKILQDTEDIVLETLKITAKAVFWQGKLVFRRTRSNKGKKVVRLLIALATHPDEVLDQDFLFKEVWPDSSYMPVADPVIALGREIASLRKRFKKVDPEFTRIKSQRDKGYVWQTSVQSRETLILTDRERRVANALWEAAPNPVTYAQLYPLLGRPNETSNETSDLLNHLALRVLIFELRVKFKQGKLGPIKNVRGVGYSCGTRIIVPSPTSRP